MRTVKFLAAMGVIVAVVGWSSVPETSSRFHFAPSYDALPGLD
ncbi:hypothetical protein [Lutimaribacter degradans]|nr:hypothetical protein [Lutimaribacter sp. EGI FJ00013]